MRPTRRPSLVGKKRHIHREIGQHMCEEALKVCRQWQRTVDLLGLKIGNYLLLFGCITDTFVAVLTLDLPSSLFEPTL